MAPVGASDHADPDIVVLGAGLSLPPGDPAYATRVIGRDRLTATASGRVEDALRDIAGFQQFRRSDSRSANPSAQGITFRGLGGNAATRALVLLDGVPIADPFFGSIPFNAIAPDRLAGARITRGGGTGAFGAGALTGTIELQSATGDQLPVASASGLRGDFASTELAAGIAPPLGGGFIAASVRYEQGAGFFTAPIGQRGPADVPASYRDGSVALRGVVPIGGSAELQTSMLIFRDRRTLRFRGADSSSDGEDASVRLIHRGAWAVDALGYLQLRDFSNKVISATTGKLTLDQRRTPSTGAGGKLEVRPPVGERQVLRIGIDARVADGALAEVAYGAAGPTIRREAAGRNVTIGGFVEDDWTLGRLVLTGGVRADHWAIANGRFAETSATGAPLTHAGYPDRAGWEPSGRVGALLMLGGGLSLRVATYTGFRLPTLAELYRPFVVFPITTEANAGLRLEHLRGIEGGVAFHPGPGVTLAATYFVNRLADAVANVTIGPNLRQRRNVDAISARGIEADADLRHGAISLIASYAYGDSRVRASGASAALDGLIPAQSPRHSASATLAWSPRHGPSVSTTLRYVGDQFEDDLQTTILPAVWTTDAVGTLPIVRHVLLVLRGENLFDATIVTRNSGGTIDLGTPRIWWVGIRSR